MMRSAVLLAALVACGAAQAADAPYSHEARGIVVEPQMLPPCDSPRLFRKIASAFEDKESEYWQSDLTLVSFGPPVELGYRPWGPEFIPRRFCRARTLVSDGIERVVYYSVGKDTGTLGIFDGVTFCVMGLDRNLAYAPDCKMAGP